MYIDALAQFSNNQSLIGPVGSLLSDRSLDMRVAGLTAMGDKVLHDIGRGEPVHLIVQITEAVDSASAATVQAQLITADNGGLTSDVTVIERTAAVALADLKPGYNFRLSTLPAGLVQRFLGLRYVIAGAPTTAGKVTAFLSPIRNTSLPIM